MSNLITTKRSPQAITIKASFGPPLPASERFFTMPPSTQARLVAVNIRTFFVTNGATLQSITLHEPGGAVVYGVPVVPIINIPFNGQGVALAIAGPEQIRVPFFTPNALIGSIAKDVYALPGYYFSFNNIATVVNRTADVTISLSTGND